VAKRKNGWLLTDAIWAVWEPLIEEARPYGKTPLKELRRTISAILWRHQNGAKWRSMPDDLEPWWLAA
jgi:transposase